MILILSEDNDQTTNDVIDWIIYYNHNFVRINDSDECRITDIRLNNDSSDITITTKNQEIKFSTISSYWYRRGNFSIKLPTHNFNNDSRLQDKIKLHLWNETRTLSSFLHLILKEKYGLGCFFDNSINKLENLLIAKECGLLIPETLITSNKINAINFIGEKKDVITKAISETIMLFIEGVGAIQSYTNPVSKKDMKAFDELIFPSLFQKNIRKRYELRVFYLDGEFYSMAIFSQSNPKTKNDFRYYDETQKNRFVPYILPTAIKVRLELFMKKKGYKTGSIDILVDHNGDFIFLEVNPIGQFGMVSFPCNYQLEKKIAEYLCKKG